MVCSCSCRAFLVLTNVGSSSSCDQWFDQSALLSHWVAKCKHKLDLYCLCWSILQNYAHTHSGHTVDTHTQIGITSPKLKSFHAEMSDLTSTFDNYVTRHSLNYVWVYMSQWGVGDGTIFTTSLARLKKLEWILPASTKMSTKKGNRVDWKDAVQTI